MSEEADGAAGGVTWYDIYESPEVERSLLVVLGINAVNGAGLAAVLLLGKSVLDGVLAAGRSGAGAGLVLPRLLLLTVVMAGLGFLSGRPAAASSGPGRSSRG